MKISFKMEMHCDTFCERKIIHICKLNSTLKFGGYLYFLRSSFLLFFSDSHLMKKLFVKYLLQITCGIKYPRNDVKLPPKSGDLSALNYIKNYF